MENTTKNTPGPWKADGTAVYAEEDGIDQEIAWCYYADDTPLVAAAPEMLKALKRMIAAVDDLEGLLTADLDALDNWQGEISGLLDALDKARKVVGTQGE